jgi:osmotically-inducible protein OsmY
MDTRVHNQGLEMQVLQALVQDMPDISSHIFVAATPDGSVWLRGMVSTYADRMRILRRVSEVPGVTEVFFNVALETPRRSVHA